MATKRTKVKAAKGRSNKSASAEKRTGSKPRSAKKPAAKKPAPRAAKPRRVKPVTPPPPPPAPVPEENKQGPLARLKSGVSSLIAKLTGSDEPSDGVPEVTMEVKTADIILERPAGRRKRPPTPPGA